MSFFPNKIEFSGRRNHLFFQSRGVLNHKEILVEGLLSFSESKVRKISDIFLINLDFCKCFDTIYFNRFGFGPPGAKFVQ